MYLYELHCHTAESSRCAKTSAAQMVRFYKEQGYSGLCVTDHFLNGNTAVDLSLPWEEQVAAFCRGYDAAREEGEKVGIDVYFAWEYTYCQKGNDFLTYGLDRDWLLRHPDCLTWPFREYCQRVQADGGLIIHAHPFREDWYIDMIRLCPDLVDGVETVSACRKPRENQMAELYADFYRLPRLAGSDNHTGPQRLLAAMGFPSPKGSLMEILKSALAGEGELLLFPPR